MISRPEVIHQAQHYLIIYKPPSWFVHPPEDRRAQRAFKNVILTHYFEDVQKMKIYPVQRLDFATEGLLIAGLSSEAASQLNHLQRHSGIQKKYHAIVRGFAPEKGEINIPLQSDSSPEQRECLTLYKTLRQIELNEPSHPLFPTSRFSFLEVELKTGRWHQIRRHMNRISHPIIGDREHGCSHNNRFWRDKLKLNGLLLKANEVQFIDPWTEIDTQFKSPMTPRWQQIESLFEELHNAFIQI